MIYYIAMAAEQARASGGHWVTGHILGESKGGFEFKGFNQPLRAGRSGQGMQARYVVLDYSGMGTSLYSTHALEAGHTDGITGGLKYLGRSIHFAGSTPYTDSSCWFSPYFACSGGGWRNDPALWSPLRYVQTSQSVLSFPKGLDSVTLLFLLLLLIALAGFGANFFFAFKWVHRGTMPV